MDKRLISYLRDRFGDRLELVNQDARNIDTKTLPKGYKLISNLPYSMGTIILKNIVSSENPPSLSVVMLQKEVADRILGFENSYLTVFFALFTRSEKIMDVSPENFSPPPKVTSSVIKLIPKEIPLAKEKRDAFLNFAKTLFNMRRKKVGTILKKIGKKIDSPFLEKRPDALSFEEILELFEMI